MWTQVVVNNKLIVKKSLNEIVLRHFLLLFVWFFNLKPIIACQSAKATTSYNNVCFNLKNAKQTKCSMSIISC